MSYHCRESCSSNMVSESCPKLSRANRLVNSQMSNKGLKKKNESSLPQMSNKGLKKKKEYHKKMTKTPKEKGVEPRASIKGRRTLFEGRCWMMKVSHLLI